MTPIKSYMLTKVFQLITWSAMAASVLFVAPTSTSAAPCEAPDAVAVAFTDITFCARGLERNSGISVIENLDGTPRWILWKRSDLFKGYAPNFTPSESTPDDLAAAWPVGMSQIILRPGGMRPRPPGLSMSPDIPHMQVERPGKRSQRFWPIGLEFRGRDAITLSCFVHPPRGNRFPDEMELCGIFVDTGDFTMRITTVSRDYGAGAWPRLYVDYDRTAWQEKLDAVDRFLYLALSYSPDDQ